MDGHTVPYINIQRAYVKSRCSDTIPGGREKQAGLGTGWQHTERHRVSYGGAGRERGCLTHLEKREFKTFQLRGNPNLKGLLTSRDQSVWQDLSPRGLRHARIDNKEISDFIGRENVSEGIK